jgi:hypothetical protein
LPNNPSPQKPRRATVSPKEPERPAVSPEPIVVSYANTGSSGAEPSYVHPRTYIPQEVAPHAVRPPLTSAKSSGHLRGEPSQQHPAFRAVDKQSVFRRLRSFSKT